VWGLFGGRDATFGARRIFVGQAPLSKEATRVIDRNLLLRNLSSRSPSHFELTSTGVKYFQRSIETPGVIETLWSNARSLLCSLLQGSDVEFIFCKSMPRSGHHFLAQALACYFGSALHYCEAYKPSNCCRRTPCCKPYNAECSNRLFMQKSHDLGFSDSPLLRGKYLIQYRSPIPRLQSNFENYLRNEGGADDVESFRIFAEWETIYFINFYRKWITAPPRKSLVISYEEQTEDQPGTLTKVIEFLEGGKTINKDALSKVITLVPARGFSALRDLHSWRYFDYELFRTLECKIADACGTNGIRFHFLSST
jgi:hypothetical protein